MLHQRALRPHLHHRRLRQSRQCMQRLHRFQIRQRPRLLLVGKHHIHVVLHQVAREVQVRQYHVIARHIHHHRHAQLLRQCRCPLYQRMVLHQIPLQEEVVIAPHALRRHLLRVQVYRSPHVVGKRALTPFRDQSAAHPRRQLLRHYQSVLHPHARQALCISTSHVIRAHLAQVAREHAHSRHCPAGVRHRSARSHRMRLVSQPPPQSVIRRRIYMRHSPLRQRHFLQYIFLLQCHCHIRQCIAET